MEQQKSTESRSLVAIVKDFHALDDLLIETGGELCPTLENWLQINEHNLAEKVDNYKLYMEHLDSRVDYFKGIKEQCNTAQNSLKGMIERMKNNLKFTMENLNVDELKGEMFRFKLSKKSQKIAVENEGLVPAKFGKEVTTTVLDMEMIEKAIEAGETVPGIKILESQSMRSYANTKGKK